MKLGIIQVLKRELLRVARQAWDLPGLVVEYFVSTPYYDYVLSKQTVTTTFRKRTNSKAAVYLIFPINGLLESHLSTLGYLQSKHLEVVIVSNLPLSEADHQTLKQSCWMLIERPNYGYDFGGYRDGVMALESILSELDQLVLLNDSTWFPLPDKSDWLADVDERNVDFCGAVSAYGVPRSEAKNFETLSWKFSPLNVDFNYCSFALAFSNHLISSPGFVNFWKKLRLSKRKNKVVRRGEIGLTQWAIRSGFSHTATYDLSALPESLSDLSIERVFKLVERLIVPPNRLPMELKAKVIAGFQNTEVWKQYAVQYILSCVILYGASYCIADFNLKEIRFPFLKKTPLWAGRQSASISLEIIAELNQPAASTIEAEARTLAKRIPANSRH